MIQGYQTKGLWLGMGANRPAVYLHCMAHMWAVWDQRGEANTGTSTTYVRKNRSKYTEHRIDYACIPIEALASVSSCTLDDAGVGLTEFDHYPFFASVPSLLVLTL